MQGQQLSTQNTSIRTRLNKLRNVGRKLTYNNRVRHCGLIVSSGDYAAIGRVGDRVGVRNVISCGSIHECPHCRAKLCSERAVEIREAVFNHKQEYGKLYLLTLTIRHGLGDDLVVMRKKISEAWRAVCQGKSWVQFKNEFGVSYIRGAELTHGKNGWHPHLHVLVFSKNPLKLNEAQQYLSSRWLSAIQRLLGDRHVPRRDQVGVNLVEAQDGEEYITKLGLEISQHPSKIAKQNGKSPLQILEDVVDKSDVNAKLWRYYTKSMKGSKVLTWSRGLKRLKNIADLTDEEIINKVDNLKMSSVYFLIDKIWWRKIASDGAVLGRWLDEIDRTGPFDSLNYLRSIERYQLLSRQLEQQLIGDDVDLIRDYEKWSYVDTKSVVVRIRDDETLRFLNRYRPRTGEHDLRKVSTIVKRISLLKYNKQPTKQLAV